MWEGLLAFFGGGVLGKIHNVIQNKTQTTSPQTYINCNANNNESDNTQDIQQNTTESPSKTPELWQDNSLIAKLANFIVFTSRPIITYLFFLLVVFIIGFVIIRKNDVTEHEIAIFNIILTNILPSIIGYWFIRITINDNGLQTIVKTIKNYIKK